MLLLPFHLLYILLLLELLKERPIVDWCLRGLRREIFSIKSWTNANLNWILWLSNSFPLILPLFFLLLDLNFIFNLYLRPIVSKDSPLLQWRSHLTWWSKKVSEKEILMEGLDMKMAVLSITVVCLLSTALIWLIWKYQFLFKHDLLKLLTWEIEHWDSVENRVVDSECRSWTQIPQPFKEFYFSYSRSCNSP